MATDWTKIYSKYKGLWVALKDDETTVVGSGKTPEKALADAKKKGYKNPYLMRAPEKLVAFAG